MSYLSTVAGKEIFYYSLEEETHRIRVAEDTYRLLKKRKLLGSEAINSVILRMILENEKLKKELATKE